MASTPPGPSGLPMFGSSLQYAEDPFRFLAAIERAYGDVAKFQIGPETIYVVCDPAGIEQILVADADRYRKPRPRDDAIEDLLGNGLLLSDGETWDRQRRLARPAFSPERLTGLADRITAHVDSGIADWADGDVVDVEREMTRITLDVILDLMLGVQLPDSRLKEIEAQLVPLGSRFQPNPIRFAAPSWVPVPGDREFDTAIDSLETVIDEIVSAREDTAGDADGPMDLLSVLLRARNNGEVGHEQLRDEVMTILLAGHDTTALTLTYTWFLLSEHPSAREQVTSEVETVVGEEPPGAAHVADFEYVEWVLAEAMRLYPPVYTVFREPRRDVTVSGYDLEGGSMVMLPQWAVHRSIRFYEDPETFAPERWRPERASDRPRFAYFPFGGGPRHCIGKHLAMLEAKLILARIATQYELEYLGPTPLELLPSLTAHPKQEMRMRVRERPGSR